MKQHLPLTILLVLSLLLGVLTLNDYGESWDELKLYDYAADSMEAYRTWFQHGTIPVTGDRFENYGPFFVMLTRTITKAVEKAFPTVQEVDVQHFVYFVTFLAGLWAFYHLAIRWMSQNAALGATLLFMTQPVFWGHAFINPKDIPLLSFFLLSVYLGLRAHDSLFTPDTGSGAASFLNVWPELTPRTRRLLRAAAMLWLALTMLLFGGTSLIQQWIENAVRSAANGEPSLIAQIVPRVQRVAPELYIEKFFVLFLRVRAIIFLVLTAVLIWLYRRHLPVALQILRVIVPAGIILGLTVSIRIFGVWAGVLVAGYVLWKSGSRAWLVLAAYALSAITAMYLTWPYLWPDPIGHFLETVQIMAEHPWPGNVLFNGATYPANDLPASYMPLLLGIQLTEPVWLLFFAGLAAAILGFWRKRNEKRELLALTFAWFILPLVTFIILRPTLYDNFRQSFFIAPPIFFMGGLAFGQIRKPMWQAALIAVVILPGIFASVNLHPYEYVYYNQYLGGVDAAVDRFELEYWATSYREAAREANRMAPSNANVWVDGPAHLFSRFARPDFHIYSPQEVERADHYDVVVTLARYDLEKTSFPEAPIVYRVTRQGAVFAVIRTP
jgi:4-amino-4-deoxy-L-arabinose transferase-like glycosyltransferase